MKNKSNFALVLPLIVFFALGCSCGLIERVQKTVTEDNSTNPPPATSSNSNRSATDRVIEEIADGETTGIQECDDAIRFAGEQMRNPDDDWVTKGVKDYLVGQFKKSIRETVAQNQNDQKTMAEQCTALRKSFEKSLQEQQQKLSQ